MCGIAGIVGASRSYDEQVPHRMIAQLRHRGPDHTGVEILPDVALCSARLSIVDLSPEANQPMWDADRRFAIVFNGEIYNFKELRAELAKSGVQFRTSSDTEVVIEAYKSWGSECQHRFNGMWAFAIWDARERTLFLSRDRFGVKPLFIRRDGSRVFFASEMKGIFAAGFAPQINGDAVDATFRYEGADRDALTLFRDIEAVPAGHSILCSPDASTRTTRWWNTHDHRVDVPRAPADRVERFRELLTDAVRLRLRTDVPTAISLSGGLDSSSIYAAYHALRRRGEADRATVPGQSRLLPFVVAYDGERVDESERARALATHFGDDVVVVRPDPAGFAAQVREVVWHQEAIPWNAGVLAYHALYKAIASAGARVVLEGHGSDEMLAGYPQISQFALRHALRTLRLPSAIRYARSLATAQNLAADNVEDRAFMHLLRGVTAGPSLSLRAALDDAFHSRVLPTILRIFDRASMASSVESRAPFLDYRLVSFVFSLPDRDIVRDGRTKWIQREAMRHDLPADVVLRKGKLGFAVPHRAWFTRPGVAGALRDAVENGLLSRVDGIDVAAFRQRLESGVRDGFTERSATLLWQAYAYAVVADVFQERFKSSTGTRRATAPA